MMSFRNAKIMSGKEIARVNISGEGAVFVVDAEKRDFEWRGRFLPPNNTGLVVGMSYTLVFSDGTRARIEITGEGSGMDGSVPFVVR